MADRITANLPARDLAATSAFYDRLGFSETFRDDGWMILRRGPLMLEFFPHPEVDPWSSWFSACIRVDDPDALLAEWRQAGLPSDPKSIPRLTGFFKHGAAPRMFALVDENGSLLRVIDNRDAGEVPDVLPDLPDYYFRIRENGAAVFKVDTENRQRRIELEEIAMVNVKNGNIKPHGDHKLTPEETAAINGWLADRRKLLDSRDVDDILRAVDHLNLTAHWVQTRASDAQLDAVTDTLLLAMHDLRSVLVRKKAERLMKGDQAAE